MPILYSPPSRMRTEAEMVKQIDQGFWWDKNDPKIVEYMRQITERDPEEFRKMHLGVWTHNPHLSPTGRRQHHPEIQNLPMKTFKPDPREHKMRPLEDYATVPPSEAARAPVFSRKLSYPEMDEGMIEKDREFMERQETHTGRWMNPDKKMMLGNPCSEIPARAYPSYEGDKIMSGPLTTFSYDEDDGDMYFTQKTCVTNPQICFGPLSCHLLDLVKNEGYWLDSRVQRRFRRHDRHANHIRVYLTNGIVRYKIATTSWADMQATAKIGGEYDLADHINSGVNLVRASSSMPVIIEKIVVDERDPFEVIKERYKKPKRAINPNVPLPGSNHTLKEEVRYQLTGRTPNQL